MTNDNPTHILMTLDCGAMDANAFRVLKLLADGHHIKVTGLYVEDEDIYNAAQLPGMKEVSLANGSVSTLDPTRIDEQIANQARSAQEEFESLARGMKLEYSFQITRGRTIERLVEAASTSDMVVVNRSLRASGLRARSGTHFEPLLRQHENLLFVNEPWASGRSVVALCEFHPGDCERALAAAKRIAIAEDLGLLIAVPEHRAQTPQVLADRVTVLSNWTEDAIVDLCETEDARLLVLPPTDDLDWRALLTRLIDRVRCSLLRIE
jgi:hypothetical protein